MADDRRLVEPKCVQDVLDQRAGVLAHLPALEGDRVGLAVAGKVHGKQPDMTELGKQRRPDGGALRHTVEQDNRRAASMREYSYPQACPREVEEELAEASSKRIDDPVRMYLTQMGEIPLLTREQEIALAKKIEITRKIFRSRVLESDYCLQAAVEILQQVDDGDLPFDRTMKISTAEDQADKGTIGQRIPMNLETVRNMLGRNREDWEGLREANKKDQQELMLAIRRRRRRGTKLLEELSLRTSKVAPLMKKLSSISTKMLELEQRIDLPIGPAIYASSITQGGERLSR